MQTYHLARSVFAGALSALVAGTALVAQRPSSWVGKTIPGVTATDVAQRGKLVVAVRDGTLHVFSAATRQWRSRALAAGASLRNTNDIVLIQEGSTFTAIGSWRGAFETLHAGPGASVVNPATQGNDGVFLVRDGATLHAFSGFSGRWSSRPLPNGALISVERDVAVLAAGNQVWGFSSLHESWVPATAQSPVQTLVTEGNVGLALAGGEALAFSALQDRWASAAIPAGAGLPQVSLNIALWTGFFETVGYSAHRAAFVREPANGPGSTGSVADHFAVVRGPGTLVRFFAGPEASWTALNVEAGATLYGGSALAAFAESTQVVAISAYAPTPAVHPATAGLVDVNATVAAVSDPSGLWLYSGLTGTWQRAPAGAANRLPPLARQGALLDDGASTVWAFDARRAGFHRVTVQAPFGLQVNSGSSLLAVDHPGRIECFDPRTRTWHGTHLPAGPVDVQIWRTSLIAGTATRLAGFSALHGELETVDLAAAPADLRASSEVAVAVGTDRVFAFSATPSFSSPAQFPEFRRPAVRGATLTLYAAGPAQAGIAAVSSLVSGAPLVSPLGTIWLDPTLAFALPLGALDTDGMATLAVPFADDPNLRGLELGLQAAMLPPTGAPWVSRLATFTLF